MPFFQSILCAVAPGDLAQRVIQHAAGIAGASGARLTLLSVVGGNASVEQENRLEQLFIEAVPYGAPYVSNPAFRVESGEPVETILRVAEGFDLIVAGTHGRAGLALLLLGSTSTPLLEQTTRPVLLVPPTDIDIVTLDSNRVGLHFGSVLAAIDLTEDNAQQIAIASQLAALSNQPLLCLTISDGRLSDHDAAANLRVRTKGLEPVHPTAFIVRHGQVAEEISRGALAEHSGLVVMGLRKQGRGKPGKIATAVLRTGRALVLAVPG